MNVLRVNRERLWDSLMQMAEIGATETVDRVVWPYRMKTRSVGISSLIGARMRVVQ